MTLPAHPAHPVLAARTARTTRTVTPMEGRSQTSRLMAAGDAAAQLALAELPVRRRS